MFQNALMVLVTMLAIAGCGSATSNDSNDKGEEVSQESNVQPVSQASTAAGDPNFLSGITESNNKSISGDIHLHGTLSRNAIAGSWVILWETEGKELYRYDSTQVKDGKFDFGTLI